MRWFKILAVILFFPFAAQAQWRPEAIDYARHSFLDFPGSRLIPTDMQGYVATVWGGGVRELRFKEDMCADEVMVHMPALFKRDLKVFLRIQSRKAPLIVVIPGVFANADDALARAKMKWFSKMGYHVLTLPNCWSEDFAKARPTYNDDYPAGEANAILQITKWAIQNQIGAKNVGSVEIFGESLGALTAAVVYSRDSRSSRPIFNGATLTWPTVSLNASVEKLDRLMDETDAIYASKCRHLIKRLKTKWRIAHGKIMLDPRPEEIECSPAIVAQYSFRKELVKLAKKIEDVDDLNAEIPENLTFDKFIRAYAPRYRAALDPSDRFGELQYWISHADPRAARRIRILTSADDFLNPAQAWQTPGLVESPNSQLIIAEWGGHVGLSNTKEYEQFIRTQFESRGH